MRILGIDYGKRKIGLAIAEGPLAEPWKVIKVSNFKEAVEKVGSAFAEASADKVVVGVSEGEMGEESRKFAQSLGAETFDETLTTHEAQRLSREAGVRQSKRRSLEDAFAATIMLQNYLDQNSQVHIV